jgi:hypothetical protein
MTDKPDKAGKPKAQPAAQTKTTRVAKKATAK